MRTRVIQFSIEVHGDVPDREILHRFVKDVEVKAGDSHFNDGKGYKVQSLVVSEDSDWCPWSDDGEHVFATSLPGAQCRGCGEMSRS